MANYYLFYKRLFWVIWTLTTIIVLWTFQDYGITWDQSYRNDYGKAILNFYLSFFHDKSFLNMGFSYLYGGFFDVIAAVINRFSPFGEFETRHLLSALFGLGSIYGCWKITVYLSNTRAGFWASFLLITTSLFYGHMFQNPKDIPMATGYIWSIYYLIRYIKEYPYIRYSVFVKLGFFLGMTLAIRIGSLILVVYWGLAQLITFLFHRKTLLKNRSFILQLLFKNLLMLLICYGILWLFWPWIWDAPLIKPLQALKELTHFQWIGPVLFQGKFYMSNHLPWYYIPGYFWVQLPWLTSALFLITTGYFLFIFFFRKGFYNLWVWLIVFLIVCISFPVLYVIIRNSMIYDTVRHFLFIIPPMMVLVGIGIDIGLTLFAKKIQIIVLFFVSIGISIAFNIITMVQLHPYQYIYYNFFTGGLKTAVNRYETDYWAASYKELSTQLLYYLEQQEPQWKSKNFKLMVTANPKCASYYLPPNFEIVKNLNEADFYMSTRRWNMHKWHQNQNITGYKIAVVRRLKTNLAVLYDLRYPSTP